MTATRAKQNARNTTVSRFILFVVREQAARRPLQHPPDTTNQTDDNPPSTRIGGEGMRLMDENAYRGDAKGGMAGPLAPAPPPPLSIVGAHFCKRLGKDEK